MSEEFRNDQENLNSQQNSAGTEEHTENQSQNASTAGGTHLQLGESEAAPGSGPAGRNQSLGRPEQRRMERRRGRRRENGSSTATRLPALQEQNRDSALREQK